MEFLSEPERQNRFLTFLWNKATFLEAFVTEGLVDHFDIEINGGEPYPWSLVLDNEELIFYLNQNSEELFSKDFDYKTWFFGSNSSKIPKWTGYSIDFRLDKLSRSKLTGN